MLDNDSTNLLWDLAENDDIEGAITEAVKECPPEVATYLLCSAFGACFYPTRVGCVSPLAEDLHNRGFDPVGMLLKGIGDAGKEAFITMRMNDVHNPEASDQHNTPPHLSRDAGLRRRDR